MSMEKLKLWNGDIPGYDAGISDFVPTITPFLLSGSEKRGAVIVFPGGGYYIKAGHEGEPVARWLNSIGIHSFVLDYRVHPYKYPCPLLDAQRAVRLVRYHAKEWNIDPDKVGILGFSAGGHLAATAGTHYDAGDPDAEDPIDRLSSKPDAMVLCYPVISMKRYCHLGSRQGLLGDDPSAELIDLMSNEDQVTPDTCPAFLWHTAEDDYVPVENSIMFAKALAANKVPFELHVFPRGHHGKGLAEDMPELAVWTELCATWLKGLGFSG